MLSEHEKRALEDLERSLADDVECPPARRRPPQWRAWFRHWPWVAAGVVGSAGVFLMVEGAAAGGLALALAGALVWLLCRYWPRLRELGNPALRADDDGADDGSAPRRPAHRARRRTDS